MKYIVDTVIASIHRLIVADINLFCTLLAHPCVLELKHFNLFLTCELLKILGDVDRPSYKACAERDFQSVR